MIVNINLSLDIQYLMLGKVYMERNPLDFVSKVSELPQMILK